MLSLILSLMISLQPASQPSLVNGPVKKLVGDLKFVEGPVWSDKDGGYLVFSDIPASKLYRWNEKNGVTVFREESHHTNGNARTKDGDLVSCEHGKRRVTVLQGDSTKTLADKHDGKLLNSPNDVVVHTNGTLYFTDPTYGMRNEADDKKTPGQGVTAVYRVDPKGEKTERLATGLDQPNGLCFSPDEKILYVADSGRPHHIKAFDVKSDGTLAHERVFAVTDKGSPDGIRCDADGRVWSSAGDGIHVFGTDGKLIERILVPETPANLCFGGKDWKTLFITARSGLYAVEVNATVPENIKR